MRLSANSIRACGGRWAAGGGSGGSDDVQAGARLLRLRPAAVSRGRHRLARPLAATSFPVEAAVEAMLPGRYSMCFKGSVLRRAAGAVQRAGQIAVLAIAAEIAMIAAVHAQQPMGWLEVKPAPGRNAVRIVSHALAFERVSSIEFTLSVKRENRGNKVNSRQAGACRLGRGRVQGTFVHLLECRAWRQDNAGVQNVRSGA